MSHFVLDSSVAASWLFEDESNPKTIALLGRVRDAGASVPALWHWEIANVLALAERKGRLTQRELTECFTLLTALPIMTDGECVARAWRDSVHLAQTYQLTVYDAAYLELAMRLGCGLATLDKALRAAAKQAGLEVLA